MMLCIFEMHRERFHVRMNVAQLKPALLVAPSEAFAFPRSNERGSIEARCGCRPDAGRRSRFPRSNERGSIEAHRQLEQAGLWQGFHVRMDVAQLKPSTDSDCDVATHGVSTFE